MRHHAYVIEAEIEEGVAAALAWVERELEMKASGNPDVIVERYGLLSVEDARRVAELAAGAAFSGEHKAVIIAASRAYHEAQNALLKLFEEPPAGVYLFLILPSLGGLLPTLRSRVQELKARVGYAHGISEAAKGFIEASREERSALIKKLTSGKDEDARREHREEAISIVNGIEAALYDGSQTFIMHGELLAEIAALRMHLYDRSAPVKMILEHLAIVVPENLSADRQI